MEQKASPHRDFEHHSYYLPAEPTNVKRHLQFQSRSIADWKITEEKGSQEYIRDRAGRREEVEDSEEHTISANPADVLRMVAAVENLKVTNGSNKENKLIISADQVTKAAGNMLKQRKWTRMYHRTQKKNKTGEGPDAAREDEEAERSRGSPLGVPPIESCLRSDGSLLQEIRTEAAKTTSTFLKMKSRVLGKRDGCNDALMGDTSLYLGGRLGKNSEKKAREEGQNIKGAEDESMDKQEATSHGAAGQLTGADEHTCKSNDDARMELSGSWRSPNSS